MPQKPSLTQKQKKIAAACTLAVFILLSAAVCWFVGRPMIRFAKQPELFRQWVDSLGLWGMIVYVGMCILQVVVAIIPGEPLEICGGYAFGALRADGLQADAAARADRWHGAAVDLARFHRPAGRQRALLRHRGRRSGRRAARGARRARCA